MSDSCNLSSCLIMTLNGREGVGDLASHCYIREGRERGEEKERVRRGEREGREGEREKGEKG